MSFGLDHCAVMNLWSECLQWDLVNCTQVFFISFICILWTCKIWITYLFAFSSSSFLRKAAISFWSPGSSSSSSRSARDTGIQSKVICMSPFCVSCNAHESLIRSFLTTSLILRRKDPIISSRCSFLPASYIQRFQSFVLDHDSWFLLPKADKYIRITYFTPIK